MTRSRASARKAGTAFEARIAGYLRVQFSDDRIERRARTGTHDRGDITGLRTPGGGRIVVKCKDYGGRLQTGEWLREAETERGNDDAVAGIVVAKRRGIMDPGDQTVLMTLRDLVALGAGVRPEEA